MDANSALAPPVRSILDDARERSGGERVTVDARSFAEALDAVETSGRVPIVAEVKPTSPTTDGTRDDDPVDLARAMVAGGAAAISVLTEPTHFGGSPETLTRVRDAVDVPVLRKDFLLRAEHLDVVEADLVLVIARFVEDLDGMVDAARDRGFQPLVEVHDREELEAAEEAGARFVGVNNRDLASLDVDLETFERVSPAASPETTLVAESGLSTPADVARMRAAGADAMLIGSAIMGHEGELGADVEANVRTLTTPVERSTSDEPVGGDPA